MSIYEARKLMPKGQFVRTYGISRNHFECLLTKVFDFISAAKEKQPMKKRGKKSQFAIADRLLLTLTYLRHYPTFARLGMEFGISESYANKIYHQMLDILVKVLRLKNRTQLLAHNFEAVVIDVTEQEIERPLRGQRGYYSGKKNGIR
jgi:hypothetical protein